MIKKQKSVEKQRFNRISYKERIIIENRYCIDKKSLTDIAKELNRPLSTVIREIGGKPRIGIGKYSADIAQAKAEKNRGNQGRKSRFDREPLRVYTAEKLKLGWSLEQIEARLPIEYPKDKKMRISYEAIYQYIYGQINREGNGAVKKGREDLRKYLEPIHYLMSRQNLQISSENRTIRRNISRYVEEKWAICSRNLKILADKLCFPYYFAVR